MTVAAGQAREVLAVRYGYRVTSRAESYLNFGLYGEPDADLDIDYYFWVIRDSAGVFLVDTGFAPEVGDRRRRRHFTTPAQLLPRLGVDPAEVTAIVITHAHWDHIGNVRQFPNAQVVMTEAEYVFWTSPLAGRRHFAEHSEPDELALLRDKRADGTLSLFTGQATLAAGIELIEVGGHTPGQLVVSVGTARGRTAVLASDALHFYEEVERDRPFAVVADLPAMYRAYDTLAQLDRQPGTDLVAGHDPLVRARFAGYAEPAPAPAPAPPAPAASPRPQPPAGPQDRSGPQDAPEPPATVVVTDLSKPQPR
jgi:glyoxylase-like metal-dependent hydrolase (beta-lactamase superfamily II)